MDIWSGWIDGWMAGDDAVCVTLSPSYIQLAHALEVLVHGLYEGVNELYAHIISYQGIIRTATAVYDIYIYNHHHVIHKTISSNPPYLAGSARSHHLHPPPRRRTEMRIDGR